MSASVCIAGLASAESIAGVADGRKKAQSSPGPLLAVVSLSKQRIHIYGSTGLMAESPVSSGMAGHRTPTGVFTVLEKDRFHRSNIYSDAPMPYMQRLTWSGVALHGGVVPGYPASHGCVRLPQKFATELWGMTTLGTRVVVTPDDAEALPIEHASLPAPRFLPLPPGVDEPAGKGLEMVGGPPVLLNPVERARAMHGFIVKDAAERTRAAKLAAEVASARANDARRATAALRAAEQTLASAQRRHESATKAAETAAAKAADATTASAAVLSAAEKAKGALSAAEADLASAERLAEDASVIEAMAREDSATAAATAVETENARREAAAALKLSERAEAPISILVSHKAGKVFVRQAWTPIHEAPVVFKETGVPLGTHVYLATGPEPDGETMSWLAVSVPSSASDPPRQRGKGTPPPTSAPSPETAAGALARFELPAATRQFIEERLWTGATLIVSDVGTSPYETGLYTDFVVLTP